MNRRHPRPGQRGTILPMVACSLVALCGFTALAVDVGMIAVARTQAQGAVDSAALAGSRALDGGEIPNISGANFAALAAGKANTIMGSNIKSHELKIVHGAYHYDQSDEIFRPQIPPISGDDYNLTRASFTRRSASAFARAMGISAFDVTATATAAHRPRDVAIVLDFSGSMNNESDLWNNEGYLGSANNSPNNRDPIFPRFGHYSDINGAALQTKSTDTRVGKCNITQSALGIPPLVNDFYQHASGSSVNRAFTPASDLYTTSPDPAGDDFLHIGNEPAAGYVKTYYELNSNSTNRSNSFETNGYDHHYYAQTGRPRYPFKGFVGGPRYWGKTFFVWPPDPRLSQDWRRRFFLHDGGSYPNFGGPVDDNTELWNSSGNWENPSGNYVINYRAILAWIKSAPCPFPPRMRAGRILYYDSIPDDIPSAAYNHNNRNDKITDPSQRFWKEYIDYVIGVWRDPYGGIKTPGSPACSYGPDFNWGSIRISAKPSNTYMDYRDNPKRPRHRFWFGPMTMVQYISDTGLLPGTAHDVSMYPAKLGITGALLDIKNNHPNDHVSLILFNRPAYNGEPTGVGAFSQAVYDLGRDYSGMIDAIWFPRTGDKADVRPWTPDARGVPRSFGDFTGNTATQHGFMLAYNQFSSSPILRTREAGGWGRRGAQRLVVLETDGMANVNTNPASPFQKKGAGLSYYPITPSDSISASGYNESQFLDVVRRMAAAETDNSNGPGFSTPRKPLLIHTIAFGAVFEPNASGSDPDRAVDLLQKISTIGRTNFPGSPSDAANGYKWCIGDLDERKNKLRQAFSKIMDDGVSVAIIE